MTEDPWKLGVRLILQSFRKTPFFLQRKMDFFSEKTTILSSTFSCSEQLTAFCTFLGGVFPPSKFGMFPPLIKTQDVNEDLSPLDSASFIFRLPDGRNLALGGSCFGKGLREALRGGQKPVLRRREILYSTSMF